MDAVVVHIVATVVAEKYANFFLQGRAGIYFFRPRR